jgi:hypothetical protein
MQIEQIGGLLYRIANGRESLKGRAAMRVSRAPVREKK